MLIINAKREHIGRETETIKKESNGNSMTKKITLEIENSLSKHKIRLKDVKIKRKDENRNYLMKK